MHDGWSDVGSWVEAGEPESLEHAVGETVRAEAGHRLPDPDLLQQFVGIDAPIGERRDRATQNAAEQLGSETDSEHRHVSAHRGLEQLPLGR